MPPPLRRWRVHFEITAADDERKRREKVGGKVLMLDRSLEDILPYLFVLLGLEGPTSPLQQMDAQIRRQRTFAALKQLFVCESLNQPLVLIFEDLHWIDTETQGFLDLLSESLASARILLLVNYRPEYRQQWGHKTYYTQLRLAPLGREEVGELLTALLGTDESLTAVKRLILEKTEGTPFFMEEVVQTLAEEGMLSGVRGQYRLENVPTALHLSPTVQGVLAARIDRLSREEKELLQHLAVIGRAFPVSLVRQVLSQPEEEIYRLLAALQTKEFLYEQPVFPEPEYSFKHALTQEVAYGTVLQERRKALHEQTARAIEALHQANLEDHYSELAHHYSRSGNTEKAVEYLHLAGQQAVQRSAHEEAISHFTTALELLRSLPHTPERAQQELQLQLALGVPLIQTKGQAAPEVETTYTRARELCRQIGDTPELFSVLFGLRRLHFARGQLSRARELAEQLLTLAQHRHESGLLVWAHTMQAETLYLCGEFVPMRTHAEQGLVCYDAPQHRTHVFRYGNDAKVGCLAYTCLALWFLGYPDQALQRNREALAWAQELSYPFTVRHALNNAALLHLYRREVQLTQELAEVAIGLAQEQGFPFWITRGTILRGWALAERGQVEEGIAQMQHGLAAWRAAGAENGQTAIFAWLAEACGKVARVEEGQTLLAAALALVDKTGEHFYEAELYRLKGELKLQQAGVRSTEVEAEAEGYFLKAIETARKQQAKSWELRAVMSLSRLWQRQGKQHEAHQLLADIYGWFTEGFDTKDLQEAKALLEELS
jgi:predicted ATPase